MDLRRRGDALSRFGRASVHGVFMPLMAVLTIIFISVDLPGALRAARGEGRAGTFTAGQRDCSRVRLAEVCDWYGTYDSGDGKVHIPKILLDADTPKHPGERVPVLFEGRRDPAVVYLTRGSKDWLYGIGGLAAAVGYLVWAGWRLRGGHRQRRHRDVDRTAEETKSPA